LFKFKLLFALL